ncbi:hypothetical protein H8959_016991 [Pygathrix nigripes]
MASAPRPERVLRLLAGCLPPYPPPPPTVGLLSMEQEETYLELYLDQCAAQRFAAVIMRIREPRTTALIFSSGKMVCTGAKRYEESPLRHFQRNSLHKELRSWVIVAEGHPQSAQHPCFSEMSRSEGSRKMPRPISPVALMCVSNSLSSPPKIFEGAKERSEIYEAFENIYPILKGFKKA